MKYLIISFSILFLTGCKQAVLFPVQAVDCPPDSSPHSLQNSLQEIADRYAASGIPGLSISIIDSDGSSAVSAGFADPLEGIAMTPCTPQHGASIQKTLTSFMVLKLVDDGKLSLTDEIGSFLPESIKSSLPVVKGVTIEHLLLHTSGWQDVFEVPFLTDFFNDPEATYTTEEFLTYLTGTRLTGNPGEVHHYSDANYMVLSLILDSITGDHIEYMESEILIPLGLQSTWYHLGQYPRPTGLAAGFSDLYGDGRLENVSEKMNHISQQILGADGIITTPKDLSSMMWQVMQGDLLSDDMKSYLLQTAVTNSAEGWINDQYGPGVMIINDATTGKWIGHSGSQIGASAFVFYHAEKQVSISVMTNLGTFFSQKAQALVFGQLWGELVGMWE